MLLDSGVLNSHKKGKSFVIKYIPSLDLKFSSEIEIWFRNEWESQLSNARENNRLLFNGLLFHVSAIQETKKNINIHLINTDYRTYVCSRSLHFKNKFPDTISSKPLAACVALVTSDKKLLLEKRKGVDVHDGMYHVVGGFLDPLKDMDEKGNPDPYKSIIREVNEETGLEILFDQLIYMGLAEDTIVPHYELCFFAEISLTSVEVIEKINNSKTDGEFNVPIFIEFSKKEANKFLNTSQEQLSPTGKNCIEWALQKGD